MRRSRVALSAVLAGTFIANLDAFASPVGQTIARAEELIQDELRYDDAIPMLERAVSDPRTEASEKIVAYRLLGVAHVARGEPESATAAFTRLLELDPGYRLDPRLSPKIRQVFDGAVAQMRARPRLVDVKATPEGRRVTVSVRVEDERSVIGDLKLYTRTQGGPFAARPMVRANGHAESVVDIPDLKRLTLDYFIVGLHAGESVVQVGDAKAPLSLFVERRTQTVVTPPPKESTGLLESWWFWGACALVIAGGVTAGVLLSSGDPARPMGTLDPIELP